MNQFDRYRDVLDLARTTMPQLSDNSPLFHAPWQARIFALIVAMVKNGHLPWKTFQQQLVRAIEQRKADITPTTTKEIEDQYFDCWLEATEMTFQEEGFAAPKDITRQIEKISAAVAQIRASQSG